MKTKIVSNNLNVITFKQESQLTPSWRDMMVVAMLGGELLKFETPTKSIWFVHFCSVNLLELSMVCHLLAWWVIQGSEKKDD